MNPLPPSVDPVSLHVVLVAPEIPWNTGAIGRTCVAAGARLHLVKPLGFRLDERRVRRAGLDYWPAVDLQVWDRWDDVESALGDLGNPWFFSAEGERSLWETELGHRPVLIFGSEAAGLPPGIRARHRDRLLSIPMEPGPVRSLNLSNCVAIAAFEACRQRSVGTPAPDPAATP